MNRTCAWCNADMGTKPGEGETHGMRPTCEKKIREKYGLPATLDHIREIESDAMDSDVGGASITDTFWLTELARQLINERIGLFSSVQRITDRIDDIHATVTGAKKREANARSVN